MHPFADGTAGDRAANRDSRIQPLCRHFVISSLYLVSFIFLSHSFILSFSLSLSLIFSLFLSHSLLSHYHAPSYSRYPLSLSLFHSHCLRSLAIIYYLSLAFFPFSRFFQINIIIMIPCYEYVAPLFLSAAYLTYHLLHLFFYLSKCNRDLYKNVHLLRLIVIIFII